MPRIIHHYRIYNPSWHRSPSITTKQRNISTYKNHRSSIPRSKSVGKRPLLWLCAIGDHRFNQLVEKWHHRKQMAVLSGHGEAGASSGKYQLFWNDRKVTGLRWFRFIYFSSSFSVNHFCAARAPVFAAFASRWSHKSTGEHAMYTFCTLAILIILWWIFLKYVTISVRLIEFVCGYEGFVNVDVFCE